MNLNDRQKSAVECVDGPLLVLAGAGSGKTRVITCRIEYLIQKEHIYPRNILAITFTNKAANEMKERVKETIGEDAMGVWISTFHSMCARILRMDIDRIGYDRNFTIYDADDARAVVRRIIKEKDLDTKVFREKAVYSTISRAKNDGYSASMYKDEADNYHTRTVADVFEAYEKDLRINNALDFDDLILKTCLLLKESEEIAEKYHERFKYIMVDEYQDTNSSQFELLSLLVNEDKNICVVGDDDQSIYGFRGANINNILEFEDRFPGAKVIRLEENYRSTQTILDAANAVIENNRNRKGKTLWTSNSSGEKIAFSRVADAREEASYVAIEISRRIRQGNALSDFAVLYRTNAQSRAFEEQFIKDNIPYKVVGGQNFYARKEIKDLLSYLRVLDNTSDDNSLRRIINVPARAIGPISVNRISEYAIEHGLSLREALAHADEIPDLKRTAAKVKAFSNLLEEFVKYSHEASISELLQKIVDDTGYVAELEAEGSDEAKGRIENVDELFSKVKYYEQEEGSGADLSSFLQEVSLVADVDELEENAHYVTLMTIHGAKGLEFDHVFLVGMEERLFPSGLAVDSDDVKDLEEERRLCYVGITRARKRLSISSASARMVHGMTQRNALSRFVAEIPEELINGFSPRKYGGFDDYGLKDVLEEASKKGTLVAKHLKRSRKRPTKAPSVYSISKPKKMDFSELGYGEGDRVSHVKFGEGKVLTIRDAGRDLEVTVDFDGVGQRKLFAGFAKLKKL